MRVGKEMINAIFGIININFFKYFLMQNHRLKFYIYKLYLVCISVLCFYTFQNCTPKNKYSTSNEVHDVLPPADSVKWMEIVRKVDSYGSKGELQNEFRALDEAVKFCKQNKYYIYLFQVYNIYAQRLNSFGEIDKASLYLDSAAWVVNHFNIPQLQSQLYLALAAKPKHVNTDSAIYYYKAALEDTTWLPAIYKRILYTDLSRTYIAKAYYKEAKQYAEYAIDFIKQEKFDNSLSNQIHAYQYVYLCEMGLKDTVAAFNTLNKAYTIMIDSLNGKGDETIYRSMGDYYFDKKKYDSALFFYNGYEKRIAETRVDKMQIIPYILKAKVFTKMDNYDKAENFLNKAEKEGDPTADVIGSTTLEYYKTKYEVHKHNRNFAAALASIEAVRKIEAENHKEEKSIALTALEEKLTQARAQKTIAEKEQKINEQKLYTTTFAITTALIIIIGLLIYINQRRKKLLETQRLKTVEQQTIIEKAKLKMLAENEERKRISKEIHDDIGPALTTLNMAANMIEVPAENSNQRKMLSLILQNTKAISTQINEIVWSLNSNNDNLQSLVSYIRKFANGFLDTTGMKLSFTSGLNGDNSMLDGYKRRSIYHSVKEVLNNTVKYSKASQVNMNFTRENNYFNITIHDNGSGLPENIVYGNGLGNIKENIMQLNGKVFLENNNGLSIKMSVPL